jgi:hypothetical protein
MITSARTASSSASSTGGPAAAAALIVWGASTMRLVRKAGLLQQRIDERA